MSLPLITLVIFIAYLGVITSLYGWLPSISDSFYKLPKWANWIFTLFLFTISMLIIFAYPKPLMLGAGLSIILVGAFPLFMDRKYKLFHFLFAVLGIVLGMISLWVDLHLWYMVIAFVLASICVKIYKWNNETFWIEVFAFMTIIGGLMLK